MNRIMHTLLTPALFFQVGNVCIGKPPLNVPRFQVFQRHFTTLSSVIVRLSLKSIISFKVLWNNCTSIRTYFFQSVMKGLYRYSLARQGVDPQNHNQNVLCLTDLKAPPQLDTQGKVGVPRESHYTWKQQSWPFVKKDSYRQKEKKSFWLRKVDGQMFSQNNKVLLPLMPFYILCILKVFFRVAIWLETQQTF